MFLSGFGVQGIRVSVEIRAVNGRFLEVIPRVPRSLALRENDVKELVHRRIARGKVNLLVTVERETDGAVPLKVNVQAARAYYKLLNELRKSVRLRQTVRLEHLLQFSEIFEQQELEETNEQEWQVLQVALDNALGDLIAMRIREGTQLEQDFRKRLNLLAEKINMIEPWSREQVPRERDRLREPEARSILLTPQGERLHQGLAKELREINHWILICGRYEGLDERIRLGAVDREISIGDYILNGGEVPALVFMEVVSRYVPGFLGCEQSMEEESFSDGLLEYPQYTRPPDLRGMTVPEVLLSGNHAEIRRWRRRESLRRTS